MQYAAQSVSNWTWAFQVKYNSMKSWKQHIEDTARITNAMGIICPTIPGKKVVPIYSLHLSLKMIWTALFLIEGSIFHFAEQEIPEKLAGKEEE